MPAAITYVDGRYTITAPFDIGPRLLPSLRLEDGSRLSIAALRRDEEGRVVYGWYVDGPGGSEIASGEDLSSGVGAPVDVAEMFGTFASFLGAWLDARRANWSDNRDIFPEVMAEWGETAYDSMLALGIGLDDE